jgi:SAM-dependent methyltransferase
MSVVAVEPSATMIRQRSPAAAPVVQATAEHLPFSDKAFDTALAVLTVHHWADAHVGLSEMRRVSHRQIVVTWDPQYFAKHFWLIRDYLPEVERRERELATIATVLDSLEAVSVEPLLVPSDCVDGFLGAYWKRPESYLDPAIRAAMSGLALIDQDTVQTAADRLADDLATGRWRDNNADVLDVAELDLGYRIVLAGD